MGSFLVALLEDEPSHATLMEYHLTQLGAEVLHYPEADSFLEIETRISFHLIIVSDQLQNESTLAFITALEQQTTTPILVLTTGRQQRVHSEKNITYLDKPFSIHEFRQTVETSVKQTLTII
ncbi:hypothetical protein M3212_03115 [Alkalihalobacillus oceani]|uniref:response regulator n=1 Tax=Halalkalibacter oceani TaxID=1653776 RepID=UPI00203DE553|nr:response regulator [Halalkalibacter oceani]MCM3759774.1 hypothetical protein [Halalkalibacter oceani]